MLARALQYQAPRVRDVLSLGGDRADWERAFDEATLYRWDEAVLRDMESEARRAEYERALPYVPISSRGRNRAMRRFGNSVTLAMLFRGLFQKDIGGVPGVSDSRFDADYYAIDGGSGKVSDFIDYVDPTHTLHQGTGANQVAIPAAYGPMAGAFAASFLGSQFYDSNRAASAWPYLHNGSGCGLTSVLSPQSSDATFRVWLSTRTGTNVGFNAYRQGSTMTTVPLEVTNGSASISPASSILTAADAPTYWTATYSETVSPEFSYYLKSSSGGTGASTAAPSASNPAATLRMGAQVGGGSGFLAFWNTLISHRRVLSAAERTIEQQFILSTTGIAP